MKIENVLSLFDGMSCGQLALGRAGIEYENYYASEIDKSAIKVTQHNYPNTIQLGSVVDVNVTKLPKIDLLIGGSPCFVAGTKVITKNAIKNIEDVVVGDYVLTHTNTFQKVLNVGGKYSNTLELKAQGVKPTKTTHEHPYYVRSVIGREWDDINKTSYRKFSAPYWKNAGELTKGDFIGMPRLSTTENIYNLTNEECWVIGRYIADGHTRKDYRTTENRPNDRHWQLILCVAIHKLDVLKATVKELNYSTYPHTKSVTRVVFSNKRLVEIVESECGCGAENKNISMNLLNLPVDLLKSLLDGYLSGDGSGRNGVYSTNSVSENLIMTINLAILKVYGVNSSYDYTKRPDTRIIEGRTVNQKDTYTTRFRFDMKKQSNAKLIDDIMWLPVRSVIETDTNYVYNLEVETDNSYTANNIIVHNCQSFSFSGKMNGMTTKCGEEVTTLERYLELKNEGFQFEGQSYLFWEYVRILSETKPKYFLLENVVMHKKWEAVITKTLGVEPIMINSSLLSAQNRKRLYWTNIPNVTQPEDKGITWGDVKESGVNGESYYYTENALHWLAQSSRKRDKVLTAHQNSDKMQMIEASHCKKYSNQRFFGIVDTPNDTQAVARMVGRCIVDGKRVDGKMNVAGMTTQYIEFRYDGKTNCLTTVAKDNVVVPFTKPNRVPIDEFFFRYITPLECERLQTVPDNYSSVVSDTQRYRMCGNGWTVDVIAHILRNIV